MKLHRIALITLVLVFAIAWPTTALAGGVPDDKVVFGGTYTLASGETLNGNLVIFGGSATLESGSTVNGDVVMLGGVMDVGGEVNGDVVAIAGSVGFGTSAIIRGDLIAPASTIERMEGSQVMGEVIIGSGESFSFPFSAGRATPQPPPGLNLIVQAMWFLFRTFALAALAVLVIMFLPESTQRVADAVTGQPVISGGLGLLTIVVLPILLVILAITILLIPVSLLGVLLLGIGIIFGWIALGLEVGQRFSRMVGRDWPLPVAAGLGTFLLTFVVNSIGLIDCIGWLAPFLVTILGLGGVILTRFGYQEYLPVSAQPVGRSPTAPSPPPILDDKVSDQLSKDDIVDSEGRPQQPQDDVSDTFGDAANLE